MDELTLESLARRVEALERQLAILAAQKQPRVKDWRRVVGLSEENEFTRLMQAEIEANSEAERRAAQEGAPE
ncbi:hypothetical protein GobsT_60590 [Gemmata obscuriglobus]|uniref:Uncharacterized protein n=1 Tax=Gemmata obscuriglobus TaxID=114 RepID=A0A2Z3GS59_9BACT|nr:hypothetical protein [Gemmata obscuriglobus]AWM36168.1 hypothetical protein C1280_03525 [Gemmata obscuriglobus]QEG31238.1 hypothetical protein GobsT_60590 [Gemmata obscuriglobus]VTS10576.1 unnamed protein product [Gemmata obscuriglobus UQM 2246]